MFLKKTQEVTNNRRHNDGRSCFTKKIRQNSIIHNTCDCATFQKFKTRHIDTRFSVDSFKWPTIFYEEFWTHLKIKLTSAEATRTNKLAISPESLGYM